MVTKEDNDFIADLLVEVDTNIPTPARRTVKEARSGERRKARELSPAPEPVQKKKKILDTRRPSPPARADSDDDGYAPVALDDEPLDVPMSDPAPSSPAAKVAERKQLVKQEVKKEEEDDDDDLMEVAHAGAINLASVNLTGSRPVKKIIKPEALPTLPNSSPGKAADVAVDSSSWNDLTNKLNVVSSSASEIKSAGKLDHTDAIEEDGSLNFFWTDYTEVNGSLCLFGKVLNKKTSTYVSCFVKVDNILRKLFFLPREHRAPGGVETDESIEMMDVYNEVDELMTKMNVGMFKIKPSTRKYAFELPGIPAEAQYMKLLYPYTSKLTDPLAFHDRFSFFL